MTKRMLIDASHAEETRVVVLDGNRLEDFDVETASRRQIKGNIYLAKVIRVEPSLQAAFVEYGGNRHGFLAFGEIHPDYYQIPVADRQRLLAQQAEDEARDEAEADAPRADAPRADAPRAEVPRGRSNGQRRQPRREPAGAAPETAPQAAQALDVTAIDIIYAPPPYSDAIEADPVEAPAFEDAAETFAAEPGYESEAGQSIEADDSDEAGETIETDERTDAPQFEQIDGSETTDSEAEQPAPESMGGDGDDAAEARERRQRQRFLRNYKIQEVIHRRQIMLIQVVKEERGNKGAALTTYLSLAGRFSVLMPNSPSGGGVSRKITSVADRRRLKEAMAELDVPDGMGLIVRTAGANRPKPEIIRDCEYLLRLWDDIRERTMESSAPSLIYEEASLIKRSIRDVYTRDVEEVLVDGEEGFRAARDFMRMLMPSHARKVQLWTDGQPLFAKHQVEAQLDAMLNPIVQLRSGGYIVINQTEALVAIDVNSGRSTRERSIEDTALRTNMEAAEEAARQLRMRDLAGLIVIDFIDMESRKNNASVERKMKDSLKTDRARIQVGSISHFGLMELSRQRLRPSLAEAQLVVCPHCEGMGHVRSAESAALHILRAIEDEGAKFRAAEIAVYLPPEIALYLFNHKRDRLTAIETRYSMRVLFSADNALTGTNFRIEKIKVQTATQPYIAPPTSYAASVAAERAAPVIDEEPEVESDDEESPSKVDAVGTPAETAEEGERRRRRRRRRGKRRTDAGGEAGAAPDGAAPDGAAPDGDAEAVDGVAQPETGEIEPAEPAPALAVSPDQPTEFDLVLAAALAEPAEPGALDETAEAPVRKRRARGGRRRKVAGDEGAPGDEAPAEPVYADVADIFEAAERAEAQSLRLRDETRAAAAALETAVAELEPAIALVMEAALPPGVAAEAEPAGPSVAWTEPAAEPAVLPHVPDAAPAAPAAIEPAVKPIVIGVDEPVPVKKSGWWRR